MQRAPAGLACRCGSRHLGLSGQGPVSLGQRLLFFSVLYPRRILSRLRQSQRCCRPGAALTRAPGGVGTPARCSRGGGPERRSFRGALLPRASLGSQSWRTDLRCLPPAPFLPSLPPFWASWLLHSQFSSDPPLAPLAGSRGEACSGGRRLERGGHCWNSPARPLTSEQVLAAGTPTAFVLDTISTARVRDSREGRDGVLRSQARLAPVQSST